METIEKTIEVDAPVSTVYNQWTQFEEFPKFMEGVREVRQLNDKTLHWCAEIGGKEKEWTAEIYEQIPDRRIAWRSTAGTYNAGSVSFMPSDGGRTNVALGITYEPQGFLENAADATGFISRRIEGDLKRFREFIEKRGLETGGWRGQITSNR